MPENRWYEFTFKFQSTASFTPIPYGGGSSLYWNPYLRLVSVKLAPFKANTHVSSFEVYQPDKGRFGLSDNVDLGQAEFANYNDRGITLSLVNGFRNTISVGPELNNGDYCRPIGSYVVPIPSSIEVRAEGGTPV